MNLNRRDEAILRFLAEKDIKFSTQPDTQFSIHGYGCNSRSNRGS